MKQIPLIITILTFLVRPGHADIYLPAGEVPAMSLIEAVKMCEQMAQEAGIGKFNPSSAYLMSGKQPGTGFWRFKQYTKAREEYLFFIAFDENTATLWKMADHSGIMKADVKLTTYRIEGRKLIPFPVAPPPPEATDDPFANEPTPEHPDSGSRKDGKAAPKAPDPVPPPPNDKPNKPADGKLLHKPNPHPQPRNTP